MCSVTLEKKKTMTIPILFNFNIVEIGAAMVLINFKSTGKS
jgi:hypothetical protein